MIDVYSKLGLDELGIDKTKFRDKDKQSISLGMRLEDNAVSFLQTKFIDKENHEYFKSQFAQAISGDGNELIKMDAAKSSSLCSLLFFYNVQDKPGHQLTINGITYTKSYFEYKNNVYRNPSNMDVVLTNNNGDILFVECKFSEYLEHDKPYISSTYFTNSKSSRLMNEMLDKKILNECKKDHYYALFDKKPIYTTGLKQIVAHYVGVNNFIKKNYCSGEYGDDRDSIKEIKDQKVRFIEVVFDLGDELSAYRKASDILIKDIINNPEVFFTTKTYQEILEDNPDYKLDKNVKTYYKY